MAQPFSPAQVVWIFAAEDESVARELLDLAAVLELQGLLKNWSRFDLHSGHAPVDALVARARSADVLVLLLSAALPSAVPPPQLEALVAEASASHRTRVVAVAVRPGGELFGLSPRAVLPRDGAPLLGRPNRRDAMLEVIGALQSAATLRRSAAAGDLGALPLGDSSPPPVAIVAPASAPTLDGVEPLDAQLLATSINDIFRLDGPPTHTFVEPAGFGELKLELRTMGTGLILEGPSKVGKSTATRKAMAALGVPPEAQIWWHGQDLPPLVEFQRTLDQLRSATTNTWLFIDDFHYVEDPAYRRSLAVCMKLLADQDQRHGKVTLIGINPLGESLISAMPDLAGRYRAPRLFVDRDLQVKSKVAELIILGERAANLRFTRRDEFVDAAGGSFFLAQWLCNRAAVKAGFEAAQPRVAEVSLGPADVIGLIQGELSARFRGPLIDFAGFDQASPPPRGAALSLLWLLGRSPEGFVPVKEARLRFPMLTRSLDWFLASNLTQCFRDHPRLRGLLYYNPATTTLTLEDPQLKFYLRELDWVTFAEASGLGQVAFHAEDGPLWPRGVEATGTAHGSSIVTGTGSVLLADVKAHGNATVGPRPRRLLHLSDLHFSNLDQSKVAYAQLAADLRQQDIDAKLDALVVSGDLVNRADPKEYDAARFFLELLMNGFGLSSRQVVLVPGNHDVSWDLSRSAYQLVRRSEHRAPLVPGSYVEHSTSVIEVRDDDRYGQRFQPFADLVKTITGEPYPLAAVDQATLHSLDDGKLLVLGLNSAWENDHHFPDRASIHGGALADALIKLGPASAEQLRVAVFHHPIHSGEESRIKDVGFLQQLAVHGFRLVLHGHVHRADASLYRYDRSPSGGRQLEVVAAGTFGAPTREWVPGYPLQYNLLLIAPDAITVETRKREEVNGAWSPDARWQQGPGQDPLPRYVIPRSPER